MKNIEVKEENLLGEIVDMMTGILAKPAAEKAKKIKDKNLRNVVLRFIEDVEAVKEVINNRHEIQDMEDMKIIEMVLPIYSMLAYNASRELMEERIKDNMWEEK